MMRAAMCLSLAVLSAPGFSQETKDTPKPASETATGPRTPVEVQFVVTRYRREKKVASKPYTLRLTTDEKGAFFLGTQVPYRTASPQIGPMVAFKSIGASAGCLVRHDSGGRFRMEVDFDDSPGFVPPGLLSPADRVEGPMPHKLSAKAVVYLKDGQTAPLVSVVDPLTGDVGKVEVTLRAVPAAPATAAPKTAGPFEAQFVLSRQKGDEPASREPYTVRLHGEERGALFAGAQVPYRVGSPSGATLTFKDAGTKAACLVRPAADGRYELSVDLDHSSIFPGDDAPASSRNAAPEDRVDGPMLRAFTTKSTVFLREGETVLLASAIDPVTGELTRVEVTLSAVK